MPSFSCIKGCSVWTGGAEPTKGNISDEYVHVFLDGILGGRCGCYLSELICVFRLDLEALAVLLREISAQFGQTH